MKRDDGAKDAIGSARTEPADQPIPARQHLEGSSPEPKNARIYVLAVLALTVATPSVILHAATLCTSVVESGWASAPTEQEATDRAILWWSSRAGALGPGYESWDRAQRKDIRCEPVEGQSSFRCMVKAAPCLPDGQVPAPKNGDPLFEL